MTPTEPSNVSYKYHCPGGGCQQKPGGGRVLEGVIQGTAKIPEELEVDSY